MSSRQPDPSTNDGCHTFQLIHGDGEFNSVGLKDFETKVQLNQNVSYAVVAIIGPQSSGKSTLLNYLFGTNFTTMDSSSGRSQTTQGIWLACPNIESKHFMLVMDIEGTDGSERQGDTTFEKQSGLFALAVANVVMVNIWYTDIGREQGAGKPLLSALLQQKKIKFCDKQPKITLMLVIRDKGKTPVEKLERSLNQDINTIWDSIPTPKGKNISLDEVFEVKFVFLPHYEYQNEDFRKEVLIFQKRLVQYCTAAGDQKLPTSGFSTYAQTIWIDIKGNKNLNLPAHKDMVATILCEKIKTEKYKAFKMNKGWLKLDKATQLGNWGDIRHLWETVNSVLKICVSEYDKEASYFSEEIRTEKQENLVKELFQLVEPVYRAFLNHLRREHLEIFMKLFDNSDGPDISDDRIQSYLNEFKEDSAAVSIDLWKWDTGKETAELESGMRSYVTTKQENKLALKIKEIYKPKLKQELSRYVIQFLCEETDPTWSKMRKHYKSLINSEVSSLKVTFSELGVKEDDQEKKEESLNKYAEAVVKAEARKESNRAEEHMKKKFENLFMENSSSRDWDSDEAVKAAAINSLHIPLMLLAGLVAIRLEDSDAADNIQYILASAFLAEYKNALKDLESDTWAQIKSSKETLITPSQCKESWKRFVDDATRITNQFLGDLKKDQKKKLRLKRFAKFVKFISSMLAVAAAIFQMTGP